MRHWIKQSYATMAAWAAHRYALPALLIFCFLESFILPLSPLILLIPMSLAKPKRSWLYAFYATLASMVGSAIGYGLGHFFMRIIEPYVIQWGYEQTLIQAKAWYQVWGYWAMFVSSLFPIPYKIFTIAAGAIGLPFVYFLLVSLLVRWLHFALIPIAVVFFKDLLVRYFAYLTRYK